MGRVVGLDVGDRRIGVAVSDALGITAQRLTVIERTARLEDDLAAIARVAEEQHAEAIVVGLPLTMQGEQGTQAKKIVSFAGALRTRVSCPVELLDERLTTAQGQRALLETDASRARRKELIDQVAAQLILQHYLDGKANR